MKLSGLLLGIVLFYILWCTLLINRIIRDLKCLREENLQLEKIDIMWLMELLYYNSKLLMRFLYRLFSGGLDAALVLEGQELPEEALLGDAGHPAVVWR
jgi:hypothetical protein